MKSPRWARKMVGHVQTVAPTVNYAVYGAGTARSQPWTARVPNEFGEEICHTGRFCDVEGANKLVVILHGLGGRVDRGYCLEAARAAERVGLASLRLALRGADGRGRDFHHAGFTADLGPILARREWDRFEEIAFVGYSLGGHIALKAALEQVDERLSAVAAICPPLDLRATQKRIDSAAGWLYRRAVLKALKEVYPQMIRGKVEGITPLERVMQARTLREWDALTVVPRFRFCSVDEYYETQSVGPRLKEMELAALVVVSPEDPMIPAASLRRFLADPSDRVTVRWVKGGGHVFFPPRTDLGFGGDAGVPAQVMSWIASALRDGS